VLLTLDRLPIVDVSTLELGWKLQYVAVGRCRLENRVVSGTPPPTAFYPAPHPTDPTVSGPEQDLPLPRWVNMWNGYVRSSFCA